LPQGGRSAKGKPLVNLLALSEHENITAVLPVSEFQSNCHVLMATAAGVIKKVPLDHFARPRSSGIIAISLDNNDHLIGAGITNGNHDVMLFTSAGKAIRFHEEDVRAMGRNARGVKGVQLGPGQTTIAMIIAEPGTDILTVTENGYGKRTNIDQYPRRHRASKGVIAIQSTEKNGSVISAVQVSAQDEVMLISDQGTLVRLATQDISVMGRNTQGVKLISVGRGERVVGLQSINEEESV
jgi:DNA gyrase subunit A